MQTRPHPKDKSTKRVWLSHREQQKLVEHYSEKPSKRVAMQLALHGLRSAEVMGVSRRRFRAIDGSDELYMLKVPEEDAKKTSGPGSNARECPISPTLHSDAKTFANARNLNRDETLFDVNQRQVRRWLENARDEFFENTEKDGWQFVSMHDLRRTWATDTYYSLATAGVPSAKELTMSWGGWAMTESGRAVFTNNYLGPVPDHVTVEVAQHLNYL